MQNGIASSLMHKLCHYDVSVMTIMLEWCVFFYTTNVLLFIHSISLSHMQPSFVDFKETVDNTTILGELLMKSIIKVMSIKGCGLQVRLGSC